MKITLPLLLAFILCTTTSLWAQSNYTVRGAAVDTDLVIKMQNTSISVLNAKDSILRKFTRATENGSFAINGLSAGKYILLVAYPEYADYVEPFTLDPAHPTHDFGNITMKYKEKLLKEVLIKGVVQAIKIKGDTTEFNAKAYVIQPNDKVEDLLKQLPGIQVDKDGKITANGEAVTKVLLDGEEFFGDDPTLITKNIRADMVDKLQLYDKKSDQAAFTGIDDGVKIKTINVVLKEDKKKGTFGKVEGGIGNEQFYEGEALWNKFTATSKFALYATDSNDGTIGLGFADQDKVGSASSNIVAIDGGIVIAGSVADFSGQYDGNGLPLARSWGAHYDSKWDNNNQSINTNYKASSLEITGFQSTISQQSLPGFVNNTNTLQNFDNYTFKEKADATYQAKIDTGTNLKLSIDGANKHQHNKNTTNTTTSDGDGNLLNQLTEKQDNDYQEKTFDFTGLYTKKLKRGRTFSWAFSETYDQTLITGNQQSTTNYYKVGVVDSVGTVNQSKPATNTSSVLNSNMTFTTPLTKKLALTFNYGFAVNNTSSDQESFNQAPGGAYTVLDPTYSSDYKFNQVTNQLGAILNLKTAKITWNFGSKASDVDFTQIDEFTGKAYKRTFINWLPQSSFQYRIATSKTLRINYNGNTTQPTISQLQPIASNVNPLNITIGNPDLRPSFSNNFNFNYLSSQIVNQQSFIINGNYGFTTNQIVPYINTNAAGQSTTQYVNLTNETPYNYNLNANIGRKIAAWDADFRIGLQTNGNIGYSYTNGLPNRSQTINYGTNFGLNKAKVKKYNFFLQLSPGFATSNFSLTPQNNFKYPTLQGRGNANIFLPGKFQLHSDIDALYQGKTSTQGVVERNIWNAYIEKDFLQGDNLKFQFWVCDILNQNETLMRSINANSISQSYYSTILRYFMLTVTWDFTKFGTTAVPAK